MGESKREMKLGMFFAPGGHHLVFRLVGTRSGRDAVGARVVVTSGGRKQTTWRFGGGSYLSASDPRIHFGSGNETQADSVDVFWPSGHTDRFRNVKTDAGYTLKEGETEARPLPGFASPPATTDPNSSPLGTLEPRP